MFIQEIDVNSLLKSVDSHQAHRKAVSRPRQPPIHKMQHRPSQPSRSALLLHEDDDTGAEVSRPFPEEVPSAGYVDESFDRMDTDAVHPPPPSEEASVREPPASQKVSLTKTSKVFRRSAPVAVDTFKPDLDDMEVSAFEESQPVLLTNESAASASSQPVDPALWLHRTAPSVDSDKPEEFMQMYWIDGTEVRGTVYLFGKVAVQEGGATRWVSACVSVGGCERNLFVLPRATGEMHADGSAVRANMAELHQELTRMLVPAIIPRSEGHGFRCKKVRRKYAFEVEDVPREETEYLKVVYSARHGVPSIAQCNKGQSIQRIFGASSSPLELFLLKRKLMGPCWITIRNPKMLSDSVSWCKIEVGVESPKYVSKCQETLPVPPVVAMCISLKTAVNPATHTHEVIAISCLVHTKVDIEADSDTASTNFRRFTLVRPLGLSCGAGYTPAFPHDLSQEISKAGCSISVMPNERALLNTFFQKVGVEDPDVLSSHNLFGFEFDVIINRAVAHKLAGNSWSKLGRLRRTMVPKSISDKDFTAGRILCDTYKSAKEFLRETTYSLTYLSYSQLGAERKDVDPVDVPKYFSCSSDIIKLMYHTANDASLVMRLMLKLQVIPLTKQLTNFSGNLWSRTMRGARAERIEYLLLHEFYEQKFILPEKKPMESKKGRSVVVHEGEDEEVKVGGHSRTRAKAAYAGGLVLEPKKGLYDTYILLLDFNSLYPSIIQEYNLCFTTINWTQYMNAVKTSSTKEIKEAEDNEDEEEGRVEEEVADNAMAPLPEASSPQGILPRVIRNLVEKRKQVKSLLKKEQDPVKKKLYDIRQRAIKLTANSMYGCLGFSFSRFYARPIAALVTAMGREALQRTVNLATNQVLGVYKRKTIAKSSLLQMQLDVIYGDTDSVMINTNSTDLAQVRELGSSVRREVNKLYKCLELDIDGIFKSMLLLKKKKYAAITINERADGSVFYEKEMKGLDLVRRDWCPLSKDAGKFVVEEILSGRPREEIVENVHAFIVELTRKVRSGEEELSRFVVTKGLNKSPKDYPDCKGQAHLQVALQMLAANKPVNIGDHIPYVICKEGEESSLPASRARHPDDVKRSEGTLTIDVEWYLENQILPPISRLCEPIQGTSPAILSSLMGLDAAKYASRRTDEKDEDDWGFTLRSKMEDEVRFAGCEKLLCRCPLCAQESPFPGVFDTATQQYGLSCPSCGAMYYGRKSARDVFCYISNRVTLQIRSCLKKYYDYVLACDDHTCTCRTRQQSVRGNSCILKCNGRLVQEYDEDQLYTQMKYLETLFDKDRCAERKSVSLERCSVCSVNLF